MTLFSVLIPAYNTEDYIDECLASLDSQTFRDFEVIIVDDGSTDKTGDICDKWVADKANAAVLHKENEGSLLARRDLLATAKGRYIVFLDSDDTLRSDALFIIANAIENNKPQLVAFGMSKKPGYSNPYFCWDFPFNVSIEQGGDLARRAVLKGKFNNLWNKVFARSLVDSDADYRQWKGLMHGDDLFQLLPMLDKVEKAIHIPEALYFYRQHENSSVGSYKPKQFDDMFLVSKRLMSYGSKWNYTNEAGYCVLMQYCYILKIMWKDPDYAKKRSNEYEKARVSLLNEPNEVLESVSMLRYDNRALIRAVLSQQYKKADLIIDMMERWKQLSNSRLSNRIKGLIWKNRLHLNSEKY